MIIKNQGIYFHQTDEKETGYYTTDNDGNLVHHNYEKPSFWQRAKFFATYGYEMNMNTIVTSYFYFSPWEDELAFGSIVGDAITLAKEFRKKRNFGRWHTYKKDSDRLFFETDTRNFVIELFDDGSQLKLISIDKKNHTKHSESYLYLDWDKI